MRIVKVFAVLGVGMLALATQSFAQTPFNCQSSPDGGKTPLGARGSLRMGGNDTTVSGDIFNCGNRAGSTPASCELINRFYTDKESACINADTVFNANQDVVILRAGAHTRSTIIAIPCPTPMHMVTSPYRPPVRRNPCKRVVRILAPVQPRGWPNAMAPP